MQVALELQALVDWRRGEQSAAPSTLERALRRAEPSGSARLFYDLGLPMARLVQEVRSRAVLLDYVHRLLTAYTDSLPGPQHGTSC